MLDELVRAGKLRYYGVSVEKVSEGLKAIEYPNVQTVQIIFNCFRQRPADAFFAGARQKQVGIPARVPLASGLLTGKLRADSSFAPDDHRNFNRHGEAFHVGETFSGVDYKAGLEAVEEIRALLPPGMSITQLALRWILMFEEVSCAIPGGKRPPRSGRTAALLASRRCRLRSWTRYAASTGNDTNRLAEADGWKSLHARRKLYGILPTISNRFDNKRSQPKTVNRIEQKLFYLSTSRFLAPGAPSPCVFKEWALSWAKRTIIQLAIRALQPKPGNANSAEETSTITFG